MGVSMQDVSRLLASPPNQLLSCTVLVAVLGVVHECIVRRRLGQECWPRVSGLAVVTLAYLVACVAFASSADLAHQYHSLSAYVPHVVEASLYGDVVATVVIFAFSVVLANSSMYDVYWSVFPPVVASYWLHKSSATGHPRQIAVLLVYGLWGARLTYNWARGWPGLHHVDWRYVQGPASPQPFSRKKLVCQVAWLGSLGAGICVCAGGGGGGVRQAVEGPSLGPCT
jgi:hypothetical protein